MEKGRVSTVDERWKIYLMRESANHVPMVAVSTRTSYFRGPKPREPRPDIGPPITLSRVQALGDESHKVPERLRFFHSRPLTHIMSKWNNLYLSHKGKHLMMRASSEEKSTDLLLMTEKSKRPNTSNPTGRHNVLKKTSRSPNEKSARSQ